MSVHTILDLWRYMVRVVALAPILVGVSAAVLLTLGGFRSELEQTFAAILVAAGASFVLDDPAAPVLAASPSPLWWRRTTRLALGLPVVAVTWVGVIGLAGRLGRIWPPVALEVLVMTAVALAAAAVAIHRSPGGTGGVAGPPAVLLLALAPLVLPERWGLNPVATHQFRWWIVLAVAMAVVATCSRDPGARAWSAALPRARPVQG